MKNKIKYVIAFFIVLAIGIVSINLFEPNKEQQIRGQIELLVNNDSYDYLVECANNFMELNDKSTITVTKMEDNKIIADAARNLSKSKVANIAEINRFDFENLGVNNFNVYEDQNDLLHTYSKNFSSYRLEQVRYNNESMGIPLTSRPLALYIREDMLKQYGYKRDNINTWADLIKIGKDIYEKSSRKVKIMNATGQDYQDLIDLLIMQNLNKNITIEDAELKVQTQINELKNNNILNLNDGGEFLARISSINGMREIMTIESECQWSVGMVPSIQYGTSKFYASEGENLIILNENSDNNKLIDKFITYVMTNTKDAVKYVKDGKFFSSYLYTYKNPEIEEQINNFVGTSPLIVLSNIEEKTLPVEDYDKYIKIKQDLS